MTSLDSIQKQAGNAEYMVLDDIDIVKAVGKKWVRNLDCYKSFLGSQLEFIMTDKYKAKGTIKRYWKGVIWLCNQNPFDFEGEVPGRSVIDWAWMRANVMVVHCKEPLFNSPDWCWNTNHHNFFGGEDEGRWSYKCADCKVEGAERRAREEMEALAKGEREEEERRLLEEQRRAEEEALRVKQEELAQEVLDLRAWTGSKDDPIELDLDWDIEYWSS